MNKYTEFYSSPAGWLRIEATDDAITAISFTDEAFKDKPNELTIKCRQQLAEYFRKERRAFELPLAQEGTDFQHKAWQLLHTIPFGKTISYQQMAEQYGDEKAIRALASANGKNKLAIVVPCHRVIGSDGSLTGYAGGIDKKRWLLQHEGSVPQELF